MLHKRIVDRGYATEVVPATVLTQALVLVPVPALVLVTVLTQALVLVPVPERRLVLALPPAVSRMSTQTLSQLMLCGVRAASYELLRLALPSALALALELEPASALELIPGPLPSVLAQAMPQAEVSMVVTQVAMADLMEVAHPAGASMVVNRHPDCQEATAELTEASHPEGPIDFSILPLSSAAQTAANAQLVAQLYPFVGYVEPRDVHACLQHPARSLLRLGCPPHA